MRHGLNLFCAVGIALSGCGGDDGISLPTDAEFQRLQDCADDCLGEVEGVFDALLDLSSVLDDPDGQPPSNVIFHPDTGEFSIGADLDGDEFTEAVVQGQVTSDANLAEGLEPGDSATMAWEIGPGVSTTGSGSFTLMLLSATSARMVGSLEILDSAFCSFEVTTLDLTVDLEASEPGYPVGVLAFAVESGSDSMTASMDFNGTRYAHVTAEYDGQTYPYTMDLESD